MLTREEVLTEWITFLGRAPDEQTLRGHQHARNREELVVLLGTCQEFRNRQQRAFDEAPKPAVRPESLPFDIARYVAPTSLSRTPLQIGRVLLVGACLLDSWADPIVTMSPGTTVDRVLFAVSGSLAVQAPRSIAAYDCVILQIPLRFILPDADLFGHSYADLTNYEAAASAATGRLHALLDATSAQLAGRPVFVTNYAVPQQNGLGRLLPRYDLRNPSHFIERLNIALGEHIARRPGLHLLDVDALAATIGRRFVQDDAFSLSNHGGLLTDFEHADDHDRLEPAMPLSHRYPMETENFVRAAWAEVTAMLRTLRGIDAVKLVCVDIDDTLWRGVAAEMDDPDPAMVEGWPLGFAEALAMLRRRGIILALVSKNDPDRIAELWPRIFDQRLQLDDFAIRKIGWNVKSKSVADAIREANVLPEAVLFIDDNPLERASVEAAIPGIRTLGAPHLDWRMTMLWSAETQVATVSDESDRRTEMIRAQGARELARSETTADDFLAGLDLRIVLRPIDSPQAPGFMRALELINKTNQFNTTGRRWSYDEAVSDLCGGGAGLPSR